MKTITDFTIHPTAALFPLIEGEDFEELVESIRHDGLLEPVVVDGNELIDGRNRLRACEVAKVEPRFVEWSALGFEKTKSTWILDKNITRRHLDSGMRATIWFQGNENVTRERAERKKAEAQFQPGNGGGPGGDRKSEKAKSTAHTDSCEPLKRDSKAEHSRSTVGQVAAAAGVSHHVARMAVAVSKADPELANKVAKGKIKLKDAHKEIEPPKPRKQRKQKALSDRIESWLKKGIEQFSKEADNDEVLAAIRKFITTLK